MTKERKSTRKTTNNLVEADRKERLKQTGLPLSIKKKKKTGLPLMNITETFFHLYIYIYIEALKGVTHQRERERERERDRIVIWIRTEGLYIVMCQAPA
jgi:hypothetical protein